MEEKSVPKIRILNAEPQNYSQKARQILQSAGDVCEEAVPQHQLANRIRDFDVLIVRVNLQVTAEVLSAANRLRVIVTATTGLDHIDLKAAQKKGITVLSLFGEQKFLRTVPATAEHTWALLLALMRRIPWAYFDVRQGNWDRDSFRGHDLSGKRLGILGLGRIGRLVANYGLAFGMKVGACDLHNESWPDEITYFPKIEDFLQWSEILSIHIPLNRTTIGFLSKELLQLLPQGARVINTARGAVWDESAVAELLNSGHLAGAALDVLTGEQPDERREQNPLLKYACNHDNVLITPHLGGATVESMAMTEIFMAEKLVRFLKKCNFKNA